jgi:hypothetical protein
MKKIIFYISLILLTYIIIQTISIVVQENLNEYGKGYIIGNIILIVVLLLTLFKTKNRT